MKIVNEAKKEIERLENLQKKAEKFIEEAPPGCLKWQNKKGRTYYYHQYMKGSPGQTDKTVIREYIKKNNISKAAKLAQKHYFSIINPLIKKNLKELKRFVKNYKQEELDTIYDSLCDERKQLVKPIQYGINEKRKRWMEENYEKNMMYPDNLRFETEQGDMVRSKSEVIIANILYKYKEHILYKYERPLEVIADGRGKTIYPDFTIFNLETGEIKYWEHAGRLDDPAYASEFVKKVNLYVQNGLFPGRDVLFSFESYSNPLDINMVKELARNLLQ